MGGAGSGAAAQGPTIQSHHRGLEALDIVAPALIGAPHSLHNNAQHGRGAALGEAAQGQAQVGRAVAVHAAHDRPIQQHLHKVERCLTALYGSGKGTQRCIMCVHIVT